MLCICRALKLEGQQLAIIALVHRLVLGVGIASGVFAGFRILNKILNRYLDRPICIIAGSPVCLNRDILGLVVHVGCSYELVNIVPAAKSVTGQGRKRQFTDLVAKLYRLRVELVIGGNRTLAGRVKEDIIGVAVIVDRELGSAVCQHLAVTLEPRREAFTGPPCNLFVRHRLQIKGRNVDDLIGRAVCIRGSLVQVIGDTVVGLGLGRASLIADIYTRLDQLYPVIDIILGIRTSRPMCIQIARGNASLVRGIRSDLVAALGSIEPAHEIIAYQSGSSKRAVGLKGLGHLLAVHAEARRGSGSLALIAVEINRVLDLGNRESHLGIRGNTGDLCILLGSIVGNVAVRTCITYAVCSQRLPLQRGQVEVNHVTGNDTVGTLIQQGWIIGSTHFKAGEVRNTVCASCCSRYRLTRNVCFLIQGDLYALYRVAAGRDLVPASSASERLASQGQDILSQAGNAGIHRVQRAFHAKGQRIVFLSRDFKLERIGQSVNNRISNRDGRRTILEVRYIGKFHIGAAAGYVDNVLGRDAVLILIDGKGDGKIVILIRILGHGIRNSQDRIVLGAAREVVIEVINRFAIDVRAGDRSKSIDVLESHVERLIIQVQAFDALIGHVTDIPSAAVIMPALFIAVLGRLDIISIRQGYQTIGIFWICADTDVCTSSRTGDIKGSLVSQIYIIFLTVLTVAVNGHIAFNRSGGVRHNIHTRTALGAVCCGIASDGHIIADGQAAIVIGLGIRIDTAAKTGIVIRDLSVSTDVGSTAVCNEDRAAACYSRIAFKDNTRADIQRTEVCNHRTSAALVIHYIVDNTIRNSGIGQVNRTILCHIDDTTIIGAGRTCQRHALKGSFCTVHNTDEARARSNRGRAGEIDAVVAVRREGDRHIRIVNDNFLRKRHIGQEDNLQCLGIRTLCGFDCFLDRQEW